MSEAQAKAQAEALAAVIEDDVATKHTSTSSSTVWTYSSSGSSGASRPPISTARFSRN